MSLIAGQPPTRESIIITKIAPTSWQNPHIASLVSIQSMLRIAASNKERPTLAHNLWLEESQRKSNQRLRSHRTTIRLFLAPAVSKKLEEASNGECATNEIEVERGRTRSSASARSAINPVTPSRGNIQKKIYGKSAPLGERKGAVQTAVVDQWLITRQMTDWEAEVSLIM